MQKKSFWVILALTLVLGLALIGCNNGTTNTWSVITNINQLDGTWTFTLTESTTLQQEFGEYWDADLQAFFGNITITASITMTFTINATTKVASETMTMTLTFSGGNIATQSVWDEIKDEFGEDGATFNDQQKSITWTESEGPAVMDDDEIEEVLNSGIQISGNGKQIKFPAGMFGYQSPEMIFTKQ